MFKKVSVDKQKEVPCYFKATTDWWTINLAIALAFGIAFGNVMTKIMYLLLHIG